MSIKIHHFCFLKDYTQKGIHNTNFQEPPITQNTKRQKKNTHTESHKTQWKDIRERECFFKNTETLAFLRSPLLLVNPLDLYTDGTVGKRTPESVYTIFLLLLSLGFLQIYVFNHSLVRIKRKNRDLISDRSVTNWVSNCWVQGAKRSVKRERETKTEWKRFLFTEKKKQRFYLYLCGVLKIFIFLIIFNILFYVMLCFIL